MNFWHEDTLTQKQVYNCLSFQTQGDPTPLGFHRYCMHVVLRLSSPPQKKKHEGKTPIHIKFKNEKEIITSIQANKFHDLNNMSGVVWKRRSMVVVLGGQGWGCGGLGCGREDRLESRPKPLQQVQGKMKCELYRLFFFWKTGGS